MIENLALSPEFNTIAISVIAIFMVWKHIQSGSSKIDQETIGSLQRQIKIVTDECALTKQNVLELTLKVGEQNGIINTQKETISRYEAILQNRNPELVKLLEALQVTLAKLTFKLDEQGKELNHQTNILTKNEIRHQKLDEVHSELATEKLQ